MTVWHSLSAPAAGCPVQRNGTARSLLAPVTHHAGIDARHVLDVDVLDVLDALHVPDVDVSRTLLLQVTYYEFRKEEVDAAMEGHKRNQRSLTHVPSRIENKEAFNILMVSTRPLPADLLLTYHHRLGRASVLLFGARGTLLLLRTCM